MSEPKILPFDLAAAKRGVKVVLRGDHSKTVTDITFFKDVRGAGHALASSCGGYIVSRYENGQAYRDVTSDVDFVMLIEPKMGYPLTVFSPIVGLSAQFLFKT